MVTSSAVLAMMLVIRRLCGASLDAFTNHVRPRLPHLSFITLHYVYFIVTCLISSLIFWGSSTPSRSVRYIDSIFLTVSAMTEAGLNTINLSQLNTWQQIILFLLIIVGSAIFVSSAVIHVRKRAFEIKLQDLADRRQRRLLRRPSMSLTSATRRRSSQGDERIAAIASGVIRGTTIIQESANNASPTGMSDSNLPRRESTDGDSLPKGQNRKFRVLAYGSPKVSGACPGREHMVRRRSRSLNRVFTNTGVGAHGVYDHPRNALPILAPGSPPSVPQGSQQMALSEKNPFIQSFRGHIGRNSQFYHLTDAERRVLGGIEYDALCLLSWLVPAYFVLFQMGGAIGCGAWMQIHHPSTAYTNGLNPFWTGAFFAVSAFNNSGMALLDANATALQTSYYMLLTLSLLILAGNTCFPVFLRLILWTIKVSIPTTSSSEKLQKYRHILEFILNHPRRVYTNLFPSAPTWWLVLSLVILNGIDWTAFELLNFGNPVVTSIPPNFRVLDGIFQAFAVRSGGFYVVNISGLYPGTLVLYVLMMYLSAFPVAMTIRNTNVYEERSLAIFAEDPAEPDESKQVHLNGMSPLQLMRSFTMQELNRAPTENPSSSTWSRTDYVRQQLRSQLGHDLWLLALAVLLITIIETSSFHANPTVFSVFNIIFEVVSAYGCVGISVGVPWDAYSFCGAWHTLSKLILCIVMLRGRHRGLPVAIDRAILLPDESLAWAEEEDAARRAWRAGGRRRPSMAEMSSSDDVQSVWLRRRTTPRSEMEETPEDPGPPV